VLRGWLFRGLHGVHLRDLVGAGLEHATGRIQRQLRDLGRGG